MSPNFFFAFYDVAERWQIGQDLATPDAEGMYLFHTFVVSIFCMIGVLVLQELFHIKVIDKIYL